MLGSRLIKTWSTTQPSISLSSGEADYYGVVEAVRIEIDLQSLMKDLGIKVGVRVWTEYKNPDCFPSLVLQVFKEPCFRAALHGCCCTVWF